MVKLNIREARLDNKSPRNKTEAGITPTKLVGHPKIRNLPPLLVQQGIPAPIIEEDREED